MAKSERDRINDEKLINTFKDILEASKSEDDNKKKSRIKGRTLEETFEAIKASVESREPDKGIEYTSPEDYLRRTFKKIKKVATTDNGKITIDSNEPRKELFEQKNQASLIETSIEKKNCLAIKRYNPIVKNNRVLIGKDIFLKKIYWEFGHEGLPNRHMLITGASGQGKTYSIQTMLYELQKSNIASIIFDYTEGFRVDQLEKEFVEMMGDKINQHIVYYEGVPINPFKRQEIEVAGTTMLEKITDIAARTASIFKHVYNLGDQQFAVVFEAVRQGIEEFKDTMNMYHFKEMLEKEGAKNRVAQTVLSKMTPFFHSINFDGK